MPWLENIVVVFQCQESFEIICKFNCVYRVLTSQRIVRNTVSRVYLMTVEKVPPSILRIFIFVAILNWINNRILPFENEHWHEVYGITQTKVSFVIKFIFNQLKIIKFVDTLNFVSENYSRTSSKWLA